TPPDFLKIDVEGHEAAVLDGARDLLNSPKAPTIIQFEYGDTQARPSTTFRESLRLLATAWAVSIPSMSPSRPTRSRTRSFAWAIWWRCATTNCASCSLADRRIAGLPLPKRSRRFSRKLAWVFPPG